MSDTPRTDAAQIFFGWNPDEGEMFVPADKSKQLERELAKAQEQRDRLAEALQRIADWEIATTYDAMDVVREIAREVLAKAKGESDDRAH